MAKVQPRPPCPPRVYQKLYRHFDTLLHAGTARRDRTSKTEKRIKNTVNTGSELERSRAPAAKLNGDGRYLRKRTRRHNARIEVPQWVMPVIRQLCKATEVPTAPPHIFAGVSSILDSLNDANTEREATTSGTNITALIISVYLFVVLRLSGKEIGGEDYTKVAEHSLQIVNTVKILEGEQDKTAITDVDKWLLEIQNNNLTSLDWYRNVPCGITMAEDNDPEKPNGVDADDGRILEKLYTKAQYHETAGDHLHTLKPGLGTMVRLCLSFNNYFRLTIFKMQESVDFFSLTRRKDYTLWKARMLDRIAIERNRRCTSEDI